MRILDEWLKSVFFLGVSRVRDSRERTELVGTGFYFAVDNEFDRSLHRVYFVTARHVIEGARSEPGALFVRLNTEDGGSDWAETVKSEWEFHDDPTVDVAVLAVLFAKEAPKSLESSWLHADICLTDQQVQDFNIGVGSEVTAIGLFNSRSGAERNIPVARTGVIASMPGEQIDDQTGHGSYQAYLVELLSMGGLSGSPVFVHPIAGPQHTHPHRRFPDGTLRAVTEWVQPTFVLGLIRSHWDERPAGGPGYLAQREWLNRGMAAVTPIKGVLEVLEYDVFKEQRNRDAEQARRTGADQTPG